MVEIHLFEPKTSNSKDKIFSTDFHRPRLFSEQSIMRSRWRTVLATLRALHAARDGPVRAGGGVVGAADAVHARGGARQGDAGQQVALGGAALPAQPARAAARRRQRYAGTRCPTPTIGTHRQRRCILPPLASTT